MSATVVPHARASAPAPSTGVTVLLCDVRPVAAHGISAAVQQHGMRGERLRDLADLPTRLAEETGTFVVLTSLETMRSASPFPRRIGEARVVPAVLLEDPSPAQHMAALRAGARAVTHSGAPLAELIAVLSAAARGGTVLSAPVARALVMPLAGVRTPDVPAEERNWLRQLARGVSVAELALRSSYSEREMYRLLNRAYQRLGAANRTEALLVAQRAGLLAV
ncbi:hypothetical protein [Kineococcus sp. SYSU DK003]|uniref:hypothetical protein n=1 Tax=Kineococcus sp. SYSU DK003 TaxID=3383124 RepID=UPI003D7E3170